MIADHEASAVHALISEEVANSDVKPTDLDYANYISAMEQQKFGRAAVVLNRLFEIKHPSLPSDLSLYERACDLVLNLATRVIERGIGEASEPPAVLRHIALQSHSDEAYRDFSFVAMILHPHGFQHAEYKLARIWLANCLAAMPREYFMSTSGKNICLLDEIFLWRLNPVTLNEWLLRHRDAIFLKDYYALFCRAEVSEKINSVTTYVLTGSMVGLLFLMQISGAEATSWPMYEAIQAAKPLIEDALVCRTILPTQRSDIANLFAYYCLHRFGQDTIRSSPMFTEAFVSQYFACKVERCASQAPRTRTSRRPSIAVCVSGQMRGYERAKQTWGALEEAANVDYFVHSWANIGRRAAELGHAARSFSGNLLTAYEHQLNVDDYATLKAWLPNFFQRLDASATASRDELMVTYATESVVVEDEADPRFLGWNNYRKMYYKMSAALDLVRKSEKNYDIIIRIRPDKAINSLDVDEFRNQMAEAIRNRVVYSDLPLFQHYGIGLCVGDQFYMASQPTMFDVGDMYKEIDSLKPLSIYCVTGMYGPHHNAANILRAHDIMVGKAAVNWGALMDPAMPELSGLLNALEADVVGAVQRPARTVAIILRDALLRDLAVRGEHV